MFQGCSRKDISRIGAVKVFFWANLSHDVCLKRPGTTVRSNALSFHYRYTIKIAISSNDRYALCLDTRFMVAPQILEENIIKQSRWTGLHSSDVHIGSYSKPPKKTIGPIGKVTPCQNNGKLWEITFFRTSICQVHHEPLFVSYHCLNWLAILAAAALEGLAPFHLCCIGDNHLGVPWFARVGRCWDAVISVIIPAEMGMKLAHSIPQL